MRNIIHLILFSLIAISFKLHSQNNNLIFEKIGTEKGLSQNQVYFIYQDYKGLLWFTTQDGISMYDGYTFQVFKHEPGNPNSLIDYAANTICESDTGIFWIGTNGGLDKLNLKTKSFKHFKHDPKNKNSLVNNTIWNIFKDNSGNLWLCTANGLSKFKLENEKFINYKHENDDKNSLSHNFVISVIRDNKGNIWVGNRGGLDFYDQNENKFYRNKIVPENPNDVYSNGVLSLSSDNKKLYVGTYSGLYSTDLTIKKDVNKEFELVYTNDANRVGISRIIKGSDNTIWFTTTGEGLLHYFPTSGEIFNYKHSDNPNSISENYLLSVFEDINNVFWIGTDKYGINKHSKKSEQFFSYNLPKTSKTIQEDSRVSATISDKNGNLWIGTGSGLVARISSPFKKNDSIYFLNDRRDFIETYNNIEITSLLEDSKGKIWITTFGLGVICYDPLSNQIKSLKRIKNDPNSLSNNYTHIVYESKDGIIWIGTGAGGLNKYSPSTETFTVYKNIPSDTNSLSSNQIVTICEDNKGFLWLGTLNEGLNKFNPGSGQAKRYLHNANDLSSISSNRIHSIFFDSKGDLWIGTFGGGLNKWISDNDSFKQITVNDGLPSNTIQKILEDNLGNLWLSTENGISRFNPENMEIKNYDVNDGLQGNSFFRNAGFLNPTTGEIYFGSTNGLSILNPSNIKLNDRAPQVVLTNFRIFNRNISISTYPEDDSHLKQNILYAKEIILPYEDNFISFEFAALDFNNPDKNQYEYKMEGFNKDWIYSGNQRYVTFTNLDAGTYTFRVKGCNSDGVWNEQDASISIIILPPWWKTWWAYLLYAAAIGAILLFVRQFEMKRVKLRNELDLKHVEAKKLQEVDKLKSRFFANISHEFRTPLTLVLGLTDKLLKKTADPDNKKDFGIIRKNAIRLLQLINQLLELSKLEAGNVDVQVSKYDINKFLRRILASFTSLIEQRNLTLTFNDNPIDSLSEQNEVFLYIDHEKFETIVYNLISNAIKFSPKGERIEVEVIPHLHNVDISFTNTGIGIPEEKLPYVFNRFYQVDDISSCDYEGTGIGLALVKELVELHNGEIKVMSIEGKETTFEIRIPVGRANYKPEQVIEDGVLKEESNIEKAEIPELIENGISDKTEKTKNIVAESNSKIILVVEDNFDLRNYIIEQLEEKYNVFEAEDGVKGLQMVGEFLPDLVISDIMMPKMDGYELCRRIKKDLKTSHIPIIMLTAKAAKDDKLEGLELGADDYLVKPFDPEELRIRVINLIKLREQMREKYRSEMILKPRDVIVPSSEKVFLDKLSEILERKLDDEKFGVDQLSSEIGLSRSQLHRKLKAISDQSTTEFIRNYRLRRAAELIKQNAGNMAEIAYQVGFSSQAYFTKSFNELFGCSPGEFKNKA